MWGEVATGHISTLGATDARKMSGYKTCHYAVGDQMKSDQGAASLLEGSRGSGLRNKNLSGSWVYLIGIRSSRGKADSYAGDHMFMLKSC